MDFHALPRRDLQALAKRNGVRANMTNGAMADALAALPAVDGIEEYVQQPVEEATTAAEPVVQATEEEKEDKEVPAAADKQEITLPPEEVVVLDDSDEEDKHLTPDEDEQKAPARGVGRRRVAWAEPLAATAKKNRAAARKADTAEAVAEAVPARATRARKSVAADEAPKRTVETDADTEEAVPEAVPARATRARSQRTVAEDEAPKTRRTSRRKAGTQQEEEEKATRGDASDVEPAMAAHVSSDEGGHGAEEMEAAMDVQNEEQSQEEEGETEKEDAATVAVPARATRARGQRKVLSAAEEVEPKTRRASRRTVAAQDEEQHAPADEHSQEVEGETEKEDTTPAPVLARATRARRQRTVMPVAEEEAPKTRRTSRRAVAKNNSTEQEDEEKAAQDDVSDVEAAVPAPASSHMEEDGPEEMEEAMEAQNALIEEQSQEDEGEAEKGDAAVEAVPARATRARRQRAVLSVPEEAMPARATRARRQKTVVPVAVEEAPKGRRTSRRAKTSMNQAEEEKRTQGDVSGMDADVQNEEETMLVEEPSQEGETGTMHEEEEQGHQQDTVSDVETAVPAASSDEEGDCAEEIEASMDAEDEEQAEEQSQGAVADGTPLVEEPAAAEDCPVYSSVVEQTDTVSSEEILHSTEDVSEENEHCTAEEEPPVTEDVDSSVQESRVDVEHASEENEELQVAEDVQHANEENEDCKVEEELPVAEDVQQCEATEEIQLASEETEMVHIKEMSQAMLESVEATEEVDCTSDVDEENEDCKVEEELPVAEDVQQCEATEEIQLASEETEMVSIKEMSQAMLEFVEATEEVDCTSDVDENEEFEEEPTLAELADSSVLDVQQCETTEKIQLASEDTEMVPMLESGEAAEEVHFTSENDVPASEEVLQSAAKVSEKKKDMSAEEVTNNTDMAAEEETLVATDEMPQMLEAMDEGVAEVITIDYLMQANGDGGAAKESGFMADLTDVSMEEETVVAADEMPLSLAKMGECVEEVVTVDYLSQATDDEGAVKESGFMSADGVVAATKDENAEEVVSVDKQSEAMVTDDEVHVKDSGFSGELLDVFIEEQGVVANDEMLHSSAKMEENVQEVVTVNNMWQATVTDDEGAAKESGFLDHLGHMSVDEEDVIEADEMQVCSATIEKGVEEVVTVDKLSQATVADEEWAVTESAFTGECTPVVDTARDFSDHIASPWSANVFEYATKSLSMDSITVVSEPVAVQRENDVKEGNEPEAALGKIMHSPLTIRKLRRAVAEENEADDVPLCIFISSSGGEENSAEPEEEKKVSQPEAALAKITHSPLTIRKLRRAVAEEIEADDVPLCIFTSSGDENTSEPVLVEPEKEVNEPEAALGKIIHSPLTIRKLRRAVAEENEADDVRLCIFTSSSGGEENSAEPVLAEREKEVNEHEALGSLSLRKLRTEFNQIVAVAQENEVKEGEKSSQALDKLSLRKLRTKLKETLNAHKNVEPKRVPLGRLDENAC